MVATRQRVRILIEGKVQGVFFRASACDKAQALGITGTVKNLPGGEVEVIAEGEKKGLENLVAWCRKGPPLARVDHCLVSWEKATGAFHGFHIS